MIGRMVRRKTWQNTIGRRMQRFSQTRIEQYGGLPDAEPEAEAAAPPNWQADAQETLMWDTPAAEAAPPAPESQAEFEAPGAFEPEAEPADEMAEDDGEGDGSPLAAILAGHAARRASAGESVRRSVFDDQDEENIPTQAPPMPRREAPPGTPPARPGRPTPPVQRTAAPPERRAPESRSILQRPEAPSDPESRPLPRRRRPAILEDMTPPRAASPDPAVMRTSEESAGPADEDAYWPPDVPTIERQPESFEVTPDEWRDARSEEAPGAEPARPLRRQTRIEKAAPIARKPVVGETQAARSSAPAEPARSAPPRAAEIPANAADEPGAFEQPAAGAEAFSDQPPALPTLEGNFEDPADTWRLPVVNPPAARLVPTRRAEADPMRPVQPSEGQPAQPIRQGQADEAVQRATEIPSEGDDKRASRVMYRPVLPEMGDDEYSQDTERITPVDSAANPPGRSPDPMTLTEWLGQSEQREYPPAPAAAGRPPTPERPGQPESPAQGSRPDAPRVSRSQPEDSGDDEGRPASPRQAGPVNRPMARRAADQPAVYRAPVQPPPYDVPELPEIEDDEDYPEDSEPPMNLYDALVANGLVEALPEPPPMTIDSEPAPPRGERISRPNPDQAAARRSEPGGRGERRVQRRSAESSEWEDGEVVDAAPEYPEAGLLELLDLPSDTPIAGVEALRKGRQQRYEPPASEATGDEPDAWTPDSSGDSAGDSGYHPSALRVRRSPSTQISRASVNAPNPPTPSDSPDIIESSRAGGNSLRGANRPNAAGVGTTGGGGVPLDPALSGGGESGGADEGQENAANAGGGDDVDVDKLARDVFSILRERLRIEHERRSGRS